MFTLVAAAVLLLSGTAPPAQGAEPAGMEAPSALTLHGYADRLDELSARVAAADAIDARGLGRTLPGSYRVAIRDTTQEFSLAWLRDALTDAPGSTAWPSIRTALVLRLKGSAREARRIGDAPRVDEQAAREVLRAVLNQRVYTRLQQESWQADLRRRIDRWLSELLERTLGAQTGRRALARILAWSAGIGAVAVLVFWLIRGAAARRLDRPTALGAPVPPRLPGHILAAQALDLLRAGRSREGARLAYRAAVHRLEEEGTLRIDDARTPREYLQFLPADHRRRPALARLTSTFERVWYGARSATAEERSEILGLLQDLECLSRDQAI